MHRVLLIGDSIRLHYQPVVRQELRSEAEVIGPAENCETSRKVRARLATWLNSYKPELIHLNCGLHDLRMNAGSREVQVPLADYIENVDGIIRLAQRRASVVIWATTTPVDEPLHCANKVSRRSEADVRGYNQAAVEVASKAGAKINDLHRVVEKYGAKALWQPDGVHLKESGYALLGHAVAQNIRVNLPKGDRAT